MTAPRWQTGDDDEYQAWKARRSSSAPTVRTPDDDAYQAWKARKRPPETFGQRVSRAVDFTTAANPIAAAGRVALADVVATVPRVLSTLLERDVPESRWSREKADAIEEWGRPRDRVGAATKLLTGIGKYAAMGPAGIAVGAAEAAADPRFSQTALVAELEKIQRPGLAGDAARLVGAGARKLNETPMGRAVGDVAIGEIGSRLLTLGARGVGAAGRAAGRGVDRVVDRVSPIPDDVVDVAFRGPMPTTPEGFDEFAREIVQPPRNGVYSSAPRRITDPSRLLPERADGLEQWIDREVMPKRPLLPSRTSAPWAMPGETVESLADATRRAEREARERALASDPVREAMLSRASYVARRAARAGTPLRLTGDADVDQVLGSIARGERTAAKPDGMLSTAQKAYTKLVDGLYPLRSFGRSVGGSEQLSDVATQASGWRSAAAQRTRDDLRPILEATTGRREEVMALAKAQRAIALLDDGLEKTDIPRDVLARTVQKLSADPEVAAGASALQDYYRSLLEYKRANGVLTQEAFDAIEASGDYYTPFVRDFGTARGGAPTAGGGRFVNRGTGVRKMDSGAARAQTVDPFEQAVLDTFEAHRTVAKQRVSNVLAATTEANDLAAHPFLRRVPTQQAGREGRVVAANVGGERRFYEVVDNDLYNAWASFVPQQQNLLVTLAAPFKKALQTGVTLLPDFAVANGLRDNVMTALQYPLSSRSALGGAAVGAGVGAATSEDRVKGALVGAGLGLGVGGLMPNILRSMSAMRAIVTDDAVYRQWLRDGGGGFGGFYPRDTGGARKLLQELERTGVSASDIVNPKRWVDALHYIGRVVEQAPRLAAYRDALSAGADAAGAVARSADISLDFSKIGTHTKGIAATTAFWNAKVQGWDKLARLLKSPKTWAQGAAMITVPSVALWSVNKDNPEYWERPQWERNLFWLIPKGGEAGGFWRIPKPFEVGYLFASIPERILDYAYERDPETLAVAMRDMVSTAADGAVPLLPTAAQPLVENATNYSLFRNRPIVSRPDLAPERQFDDRTSSLAVGVGKVAGVSPQKVDNLIAGYTGSAGKMALDVTDRVARATGMDDRPLPPDRADIPVVGDMGRRFSTKDGGTSDAESMFWRKWDRADEAYRTVQDMIKDGEDRESVRSFIRAHADDLRAYDTLKETRSAIQEVRKAERAMLADRGLSREVKRRRQQKLRALRTQFAQGSARGDATFAAEDAAPPR